MGVGERKRKGAEVDDVDLQSHPAGEYNLRSKDKPVPDVDKPDSDQLDKDSPSEPAPSTKSSNKTVPDDLKNWGQKKLLTLSTPELKRLADVNKVKRPRSGDEASKRETVLRLCLKLRKRFKHEDDDEDHKPELSSKNNVSGQGAELLKSKNDKEQANCQTSVVNDKQPTSKPQPAIIDCSTSNPNRAAQQQNALPGGKANKKGKHPNHAEVELEQQAVPPPPLHATTSSRAKRGEPITEPKVDNLYQEASDHPTGHPRVHQPMPPPGLPYPTLNQPPFVAFYRSPACPAPGQPMYFVPPTHHPQPMLYGGGLPSPPRPPATTYPPYSTYPPYPPYAAMPYPQPPPSSQPSIVYQSPWSAELKPYGLGSERRTAQKKKALKRQLDCLLSAQAAEPSAARAEQIMNLKHELQDLEDDE